jgi:hypothetical protein
MEKKKAREEKKRGKERITCTGQITIHSYF